MTNLITNLARVAATSYMFVVLSSTCTGDITNKDIVDAWQKRRDRIRTARIVWSHQQIDKKNSKTGPRRKDGTEFQFPSEDKEYEHQCVLYIDGTSMRFEFEGRAWFLEDVRDGFDAQLLRYREVEVFKDGQSKSLSSSKENGDWGIINNDSPDMIHAQTIPPLPAVWFVRPFFVRDIPSDPATLRVLRGNTDDSTECAVPDQKTRFTIGPSDAFLLRHFVSSRIELDIQYRESEFGMVPDKWSFILSSKPDTVSSIVTCKVTELEINKPLPSDTFELVFPPGTRVTKDERTHLVVAPSGELVPEAFLREDSSSAGPRWMAMATGAIILFLIAMVLVKHRQSV